MGNYDDSQKIYQKVSWWKSTFVQWLFAFMSSGVLCLNLYFGLKTRETYGSLTQITAMAYLTFFFFVLFFTSVIPIRCLIDDVFAFMDTRFGPALYIIFVGNFGQQHFQYKKYFLQILNLF